MVWASVAVAAFGAALLRLYGPDGDGSILSLVGFVVVVGVLALVAVGVADPAGPVWLKALAACAGLPLTFPALLPGGLLHPDRPGPPVAPLGACARCGAQLWDLRGNRRYTDHQVSYLCPPQYWQPGQHRLHQLAHDPPAAASGPPPAGGVDPMRPPRTWPADPARRVGGT
jgi:hypothetical protein